MNISDKKSSLRTQVRNKVFAMSAFERDKASATICDTILSSPEYKASDVLLAYLATKDEVNVDAVIKKALEVGKVVAVPRVTGKSSMEFRALNNVLPLRSQIAVGHFSIREPNLTLPLITFIQSPQKGPFAPKDKGKVFQNSKKAPSIALCPPKSEVKVFASLEKTFNTATCPQKDKVLAASINVEGCSKATKDVLASKQKPCLSELTDTKTFCNLAPFCVQDNTRANIVIDTTKTPVLALIPGVAFSKSGGRLGRGAGYYDRFLPSITGATLWGVGFLAQVVESVPTAAFDIALSRVVFP